MPKETDCCQEYAVNPSSVENARKKLPAEAKLKSLSRMFQAFGDPSRLKIMHSVLEHELCVCELGELLEMSAPAVSHHLRRLKDLGLVKTRREGKMVYYSLDDQHIKDILTIGQSHLEHRLY